ncbi:MAG: TolC family protein [Gammaproteobacteria bacterium]|nr:TolC family protein [Gammaproteobacteria bacterium]MCW8986523.1 TolC family protein [Gammaproteobacteria bacterium]
MNNILVSMLISIGLVMSPAAFAETNPQWTLDSSILRAVEVAPEMKTADAEIDKQKGNLEQADAWPNPSISVQADNKLGLEDASGGYDVTQVAISQALPFGRLAHQRKQAEAELAGAEAHRRHQQLLLEFTIAQRFHTLQLAEARLQLAEKHLEQASRYQKTGRKRTANDQLIRYLTPLETMRLDIVLQAAKQTVEVAEGEFNEAAASFKALLAIPVKSTLQLIPLKPVTVPTEIKTSKDILLQEHPILEADKQAVVAARAGVDVASSQRFDDPTLTLFQEQDYLGGRKQDATGIMLSIQVPLWNQNKGRVNQAKAEVYQAQSELDFKQRELSTSLYKSYLHLGHLITQAEHYREKLLQPAKEVFNLTRKGFNAGELNILTLIDANNTYFNAQERYLELLQLGWLELAELRKSAGLSVIGTSKTTKFGEVN